MVMRIPRAGENQVVQTERGQSVEGRSNRELSGIGQQLQQLGGAMRDAQGKRDIAEAETRITTARRLAQADAEKQGLWGDSYAKFMSEATRKARDDVMNYTELPEVKRYLGNQGMVQQEQDMLRFEAEGRQKELVYASKQYEANKEMGNQAAFNHFYMLDNGEFDPEVFKAMDQAQVNAEGIPFQNEGERKARIQKDRSERARWAGEEIAIGFTRNGDGEPWRLLQKLNDENNEFTQNLIDVDLEYLKRLCYAEMAKVKSRRTTMKEAYTERLQELNKNMDQIVKEGGYVSQDFIDQGDALYQRIQQTWDVDAKYAQWPGEYQIDPDKQERARRTQMEWREKMTGYQSQALTKTMPTAQLQVAAQLAEQDLRQVDTAEGLDGVVQKDGEMLESGEYMQRLSRVSALRSEMGRRMEAQKNGDLTRLYVTEVYGDADAGVEMDFTNMEQAKYIAATRLSLIGPASDLYGTPATLMNKTEAKAMMDLMSQGSVRPQDLQQWVGAMSQLPPASAKEQMRMFGKDARWMRGMMYATEQNAGPVAESIARGANIVATGNAKAGVFWASDGDEVSARRYFTNIWANTFSSSSEVGADFVESSMMALYGTAESMTGNSFQSKEAKEIVMSMFPNGAEIDNDMVWPNAMQSIGAVPAQDLLRVIDPEDWDGTVLPELMMKDVVSDEAMGETGLERLTEMVNNQSNDLRFEPDPAKPGVYFVVLRNPADKRFATERGYLATKDGKPARIDLNNFLDRRAAARGEDSVSLQRYVDQANRRDAEWQRLQDIEAAQAAGMM